MCRISSRLPEAICWILLVERRLLQELVEGCFPGERSTPGSYSNALRPLPC